MLREGVLKVPIQGASTNKNPRSFHLRGFFVARCFWQREPLRLLIDCLRPPGETTSERLGARRAWRCFNA
jgi:hypothetical protein